MSLLLRRTIGIILILTALAGLVISIWGLLNYRNYTASLEDNTREILEFARSSLVTTDNALNVVVNSLEDTSASIVEVEEVLLSTGQTVNDLIPVVESVTVLLQEDIPTTIDATQEALIAAQASAEVIDGVLRAVSNLPFMGDVYNPEVPLGEALLNISDSLDPIPEKASDIGDELESNQGNLDTLNQDLIDLAVTITEINTNVSSAQDVSEAYQADIATLITTSEDLQTQVTNGVAAMDFALTVFLAWLGFTQVGLFTQGLDMLSAGRRREINPDPEK